MVTYGKVYKDWIYINIMKKGKSLERNLIETAKGLLEDTAIGLTIVTSLVVGGFMIGNGAKYILDHSNYEQSHKMDLSDYYGKRLEELFKMN